MLDPGLLERAICWAGSGPRAALLTAARAAFEQRTGTIANGDPDYEARIAHFLEWVLCTPEGATQRAPVAIYADEAGLVGAPRRELAGFLRSYRSLFSVERIADRAGYLRDRIGGARIRFDATAADQALRPGDCFDARLVPLGTELWLSRGRVFHPQEAERALSSLLDQAAEQGVLDARLLDPLLRMRSRFLGFESIRAEHVYQLGAALDPARGAPWARPAAR